MSCKAEFLLVFPFHASGPATRRRFRIWRPVFSRPSSSGDAPGSRRPREDGPASKESSYRRFIYTLGTVVNREWLKTVLVDDASASEARGEDLGRFRSREKDQKGQTAAFGRSNGC